MSGNNLWAPWRFSYIKQVIGDEVPTEGGGGACFICEAVRAYLSEAQREQLLVLVSDERGVLMLNRYPYTNGHLLAAPREHLPDLSDLTAEQRRGLMDLTELGNRVLQAAMNPQGMNIGMNLGRCAGAGVPGHTHMHIVPRWHGDVNFMTVVGQVRVIPEALTASYGQLKAMVQKMT